MVFRRSRHLHKEKFFSDVIPCMIDNGFLVEEGFVAVLITPWFVRCLALNANHLKGKIKIVIYGNQRNNVMTRKLSVGHDLIGKIGKIDCPYVKGGDYNHRCIL